MKSPIRIAILSIIIVCAASAMAQTNRGGISGTVTDKNGGVVPGATGAITNVGTHQTLNGFELYRLRNAYGGSFGELRELNQPRYIQFGVKITF
jgi:hypothetical protein